MKNLVIFSLLFWIVPTFVFAEQDTSDETRIYLIDENNNVISSFSPFGEDYRGSMDLTTVDLGTDGTQEIIVGAGVGLPPSVSVFRQDGTKIADFYAYAQTFMGGVNVSACDVTGDGVAEIITGAGFTGGPHVRIFSNTGEVLGQFFAYDKDFRGGVDVACGDVDGDGVGEIVTGPGITGGPHVKVFEADGEMIMEKFAGGGQFDSFGARVTTADLDADGDEDIITTRAGYDTAYLTILESSKTNLNFGESFEIYTDSNYKNGVDVFAFNYKNVIDTFGTSMRGGNQNIFSATLKDHQFSDDGRDRGLVVTVLTDSSEPVFVVGTTEPQVAGSEEDQYILVDVTDQTLRAYQNHSLVKSFLVSTGLTYYPTPLGKTTVTAKLLWHDYSWYYGDGDSRNYDLSGVKYNLRFKNHYYLHYAYWHNNFGNKMSHGCVNINYENSEWTYNWANIGATVEVVD